MEPIIKVENLYVTYNPGKDNEFKALENISLEIYPQEYIIFFGPSGCGKSTLLYSILGLQKAISGKVYVEGKDSSQFTPEERSNQRGKFFGIVFQNFNLIYSLNVLDNVTLPQVFRDEAETPKETAMELLKRFGIDSRADRLPGNLSGGQQQRVAICRALVNNPTVILADEPVGNLDAASAHTVMESLSDINKRDKKTVILVTHDPSYLSYADRVFYFKDGKIERVVRNVEGREKIEMTEKGLGPLSLADLKRLARTSEFATVPQLKAWVVTNYLTQNTTNSQLERLELCIEQLFSGKLKQHDFFTKLDEPFSSGGVGLHAATATNFSKELEKILELVQKIKAHIGELKAIPVGVAGDKENISDHSGLIEDIKKLLLETTTYHLDDIQKHRLGADILALVTGQMNIEAFYEILDKSEKNGGVGLNVAAALHLTDRLKVILAQVYENK